MLFDGGFTFANFLADVFSIFIFVLWLWLLITVFGDLFRRHDVSGVGKVAWVILLIVLPYIGIFAYILTQGRGMAERNKEQAQRAQDQIRKAVGTALVGAVLLSVGALAQVPEATGPYRVSNIKSACSTAIKSGSSGGSERAGMEGVCFGAISTVMRFGPMMNDRFRFCPPATAKPS